MSISRSEDARRAIVENPFDDSCRLAWSDLLTLGVDGAESPLHAEVGEFVRLQIGMEKIEPAHHAGHLPRSGMQRRFPLRLRNPSGLARACGCNWCIARTREAVLYELADDYYGRDGSIEVLLWSHREFMEPAQGEAAPPPWLCVRGLPMAIFEVTADDFVNGCGLTFEQWPILHVELHPNLTRPGHLPSQIDGLWYWFSSYDGVPPPHDQCVLPDEIFELLEDRPGHNFKAYDRVLDAVDDLSRACVLLGRRKAGLVEIPRRKLPGAKLYLDSPDVLEDMLLWL